MKPGRGPVLAVWLSVLGLAGLCAVALTAWLDPVHALAWAQLMALCR